MLKGGSMICDELRFPDLETGDHFIVPDPPIDLCDPKGRPFVLIKRRQDDPSRGTDCRTVSDTFNTVVMHDGSPRAVKPDVRVIPVII